MTKFLTIKQAVDLLGVSTQTLRRWEKAGKISPAALMVIRDAMRFLL